MHGHLVHERLGDVELVRVHVGQVLVPVRDVIRGGHDGVLFCFFGVRHVTHVQRDKWRQPSERSFFECDEFHATTKRDEAMVSARLGRAGLAGALSRVHGVGVRDRGDAAGSRARSRRSRRAPAVPDSAKSPRRSSRRSSRRRRIFERCASSGRARCRGTYLGAAEAETALELGVNHAATAGDVLLVVGDVLVHALPAGHLDLHAVALAELGGGGAELVARDAADRADLKQWSGFGFGESECQQRRGDRARRARRSRKAPRRRAGVVTRGIFFSLQRPKAE